MKRFPPALRCSPTSRAKGLPSGRALGSSRSLAGDDPVENRTWLRQRSALDARDEPLRRRLQHGCAFAVGVGDIGRVDVHPKRQLVLVEWHSFRGYLDKAEAYSSLRFLT